jgi:hypothetical protein
MRFYNRPDAWKKDSMRWNIYKVGVVMDLTISTWGARAKLNPEDLGFTDVPEIVKLGHKELMQKERLAKINTIVSQAWAYIYNHSFAFPFGDARFVSTNLIDEVVARMNEFKEQFDEAVKEFIDNYEQYRNEMIEKWRTAFEDILTQQIGFSSHIKKEGLLRTLINKYPTSQQLWGKFGFDLSIFEISTPEFTNISKRDALTKTEQAPVEAIYAKKISEKLDTFLDDVVTRLRGMVLQTIGHVKEMNDAGNLGGRTIKSFLKFAESFRKMDFVGFDVDKQLDELSKKLVGAEKADFGSEDFKKELQSNLDEIKEKVVNSDVILGRFKRNIEQETEDEMEQENTN